MRGFHFLEFGLLLTLIAARAPEFAVDGTAIPEVDFDVGESYAGSIPVTTEEAGDNLFFWFFPSTNEAAEKEILIWLNGGVRHPPDFTETDSRFPGKTLTMGIAARLFLFRGYPTGERPIPMAVWHIQAR